MGAYQSSPGGKAPPLCSLQTKNGEFVLIPLVDKYFPDVDFPAFKALYKAREDSKTRFFYSRPDDDDCSTNGEHVSAEKLYDIFVARQTTQLRNLPASTSCPIGCAVGLVVTDGGQYDAVFSGNRVRVCGRVACRNSGGETLPWSAGIFLSHQFTEGLFKYIAVVAAAMYVHQSGGVAAPEHFRAIDFTTLQQNTSMLRAIFTLRELVNATVSSDRLSATSSFTSSTSDESSASAPMAVVPEALVVPHVGVSFAAQANRYRMCVTSEDAFKIAQCLHGIVRLKPADAERNSTSWSTFELRHRLPVKDTVVVTPEANHRYL